MCRKQKKNGKTDPFVQSCSGQEEIFYEDKAEEERKR